MIRIFAVIAAAFVILGVVGIFSGIGWYDEAVAKEEGVKAQYKDNQNEYDSFWKKVQETAQVPGRYKDDFKDLLVSETEAKFGEQGSQATMQWFQDRQIQFSDQMYVKVQNLIESGRNDFKRGQTLLLDKQRIFSVYTKTFWGRTLARFSEMPSTLHGDLAPSKDVDGDGRLTVLDYTIVTSSKTKGIFAAGEENEIVNVFGTKP